MAITVQSLRSKLKRETRSNRTEKNQLEKGIENSCTIEGWTRREQEVFKGSYVKYPKNFTAISSCLDGKTKLDCVQFYYLTKKKENYKEMIQKISKRRGRPRKLRNLENAARVSLGDTWLGNITKSDRMKSNKLRPENDVGRPLKTRTVWNVRQKLKSEQKDVRRRDAVESEQNSHSNDRLNPASLCAKEKYVDKLQLSIKEAGSPVTLAQGVSQITHVASVRLERLSDEYIKRMDSSEASEEVFDCNLDTKGRKSSMLDLDESSCFSEETVILEDYEDREDLESLTDTIVISDSETDIEYIEDDPQEISCPKEKKRKRSWNDSISREIKTEGTQNGIPTEKETDCTIGDEPSIEFKKVMGINNHVKKNNERLFKRFARIKKRNKDLFGSDSPASSPDLFESRLYAEASMSDDETFSMIAQPIFAHSLEANDYGVDEGNIPSTYNHTSVAIRIDEEFSSKVHYPEVTTDKPELCKESKTIRLKESRVLEVPISEFKITSSETPTVKSLKRKRNDKSTDKHGTSQNKPKRRHSAFLPGSAKGVSLDIPSRRMSHSVLDTAAWKITNTTADINHNVLGRIALDKLAPTLEPLSENPTTYIDCNTPRRKSLICSINIESLNMDLLLKGRNHKTSDDGENNLVEEDKSDVSSTNEEFGLIIHENFEIPNAAREFRNNNSVSALEVWTNLKFVECSNVAPEKNMEVCNRSVAGDKHTSPDDNHTDTLGSELLITEGTLNIESHVEEGPVKNIEVCIEDQCIAGNKDTPSDDNNTDTLGSKLLIGEKILNIESPGKESPVKIPEVCNKNQCISGDKDTPSCDINTDTSGTELLISEDTLNNESHGDKQPPIAKAVSLDESKQDDLIVCSNISAIEEISGSHTCLDEKENVDKNMEQARNICDLEIRSGEAVNETLIGQQKESSYRPIKHTDRRHVRKHPGKMDSMMKRKLSCNKIGKLNPKQHAKAKKNCDMPSIDASGKTPTTELLLSGLISPILQVENNTLTYKDGFATSITMQPPAECAKSTIVNEHNENIHYILPYGVVISLDPKMLPTTVTSILTSESEIPKIQRQPSSTLVSNNLGALKDLVLCDSTSHAKLSCKSSSQADSVGITEPSTLLHNKLGVPNVTEVFNHKMTVDVPSNVTLAADIPKFGQSSNSWSYNLGAPDVAHSTMPLNVQPIVTLEAENQRMAEPIVSTQSSDLHDQNRRVGVLNNTFPNSKSDSAMLNILQVPSNPLFVASEDTKLLKKTLADTENSEIRSEIIFLDDEAHQNRVQSRISSQVKNLKTSENQTVSSEKPTIGSIKVHDESYLRGTGPVYKRTKDIDSLAQNIVIIMRDKQFYRDKLMHAELLSEALRESQKTICFNEYKGAISFPEQECVQQLLDPEMLNLSRELQFWQVVREVADAFIQKTKFFPTFPNPLFCEVARDLCKIRDLSLKIIGFNNIQHPNRVPAQLPANPTATYSQQAENLQQAANDQPAANIQPSTNNGKIPESPMTNNNFVKGFNNTEATHTANNCNLLNVCQESLENNSCTMQSNRVQSNGAPPAYSDRGGAVNPLLAHKHNQDIMHLGQRGYVQPSLAQARQHFINIRQQQYMQAIHPAMHPELSANHSDNGTTQQNLCNNQQTSSIQTASCPDTVTIPPVKKRSYKKNKTSVKSKKVSGNATIPESVISMPVPNSQQNLKSNYSRDMHINSTQTNIAAPQSTPPHNNIDQAMQHISGRLSTYRKNQYYTGATEANSNVLAKLLTAQHHKPRTLGSDLKSVAALTRQVDQYCRAQEADIQSLRSRGQSSDTANAVSVVQNADMDHVKHHRQVDYQNVAACYNQTMPGIVVQPESFCSNNRTAPPIFRPNNSQSSHTGLRIQNHIVATQQRDFFPNMRPENHTVHQGGLIPNNGSYGNMQQSLSRPNNQTVVGQQGGFSPNNQHRNMQQGSIGPINQAVNVQQGVFSPNNQRENMQQGFIGPNNQTVRAQQECFSSNNQHRNMQQGSIGPNNPVVGVQQAAFSPNNHRVNMQQSIIGPYNQTVNAQQECLSSNSQHGNMQQGSIRPNNQAVGVQQGAFSPNNYRGNMQRGFIRPYPNAVSAHHGGFTQNNSSARMQQNVFNTNTWQGLRDPTNYNVNVQSTQSAKGPSAGPLLQGNQMNEEFAAQLLRYHQAQINGSIRIQTTDAQNNPSMRQDVMSHQAAPGSMRPDTRNYGHAHSQNVIELSYRPHVTIQDGIVLPCQKNSNVAAKIIPNSVERSSRDSGFISPPARDNFQSPESSLTSP